MGSTLAVCVDVGSTFTKAALVDTETGELRGTAGHRTTLETDVMTGLHACVGQLLAAAGGAGHLPVLACSSAGGGLRIAVVGNEELVTAEAGRRVALSSGGTVVHVAAVGGAAGWDLDALWASAPDVVLLTGGTDGGDAESLLTAARALASRRYDQVPVVVAGNVDAREEVAALLEPAGTPYVLADNVLPRIGVLAPASARAAVREVFLRHVIGGKQLSSNPAFARIVRGATPDLVLTGVELLSRVVDAEVVVVDVGGATTDVHSVVDTVTEPDGLSREVVASAGVARTVEGDLGMRWSAVGAVEAGLAGGLLAPEDAARMRAEADRRTRDPAYLPLGEDEVVVDRLLARLCAAVALRRHAGRSRVAYGPDGRVVERSGVDLREVRLVVGSGGVLRHDPAAAHDVLEEALEAGDDGWQLPRRPRVVVDADYVLAAAGLLARDHPEAARALLRARLAEPHEAAH